MCAACNKDVNLGMPGAECYGLNWVAPNSSVDVSVTVFEDKVKR